jgi:hypothetical protein
MIIYIIIEHVDYEGEEIWSAHKTKDGAVREVEKILETKSGFKESSSDIFGIYDKIRGVGYYVKELELME